LNFFQSYYQKVLVNLASRSLVIVFGKPYFVMIVLNTRSATYVAVAGSLVGMKCAILENLSTITKTPEDPEGVSGKSVRKSIDMSSHGAAGVGNGCRSPAERCDDVLMR